MCLKVGHICATISFLACTTFVLVRCEDWLPFAAYGVKEIERNSAGKNRRAWHGHGNLSIEKNCKPCLSNATCKQCVFSGIRFLSGQIKFFQGG